MTKFDRRYKGEDTHTLDGASVTDTAGVISLVLVVGLLYFLGSLIGQALLWWAHRLHFLTHTDEVLATYHIDSPGKHRLHARAAALCLAAVVGGVTALWLGYQFPWPLVAIIGTVGYTSLTVIYFQNRNEDPVANSWD